MTPLQNRKWAAPENILAVLFFTGLFFLCVNVDFTTDRSDGIFHYLFAKSAPQNPLLFLDLWAKPLFTLFASPFAQLGIQGMHFMNVLCAVATSLICCSIARRLGMKHQWLLFFFIVLSPVYFQQIASAMTEPFFALMLSLIVLLFLKQQFLASAILASFLHLARQEGYFLLPLLLVIFIVLKQWKAIPFLLTGSIVFSIITWLSIGDAAWLFHAHPYTGAKEIYGEGSLLHFLKNSEAMFGFALQALTAIGIIVIILRFRTSRKIRGEDRFVSFTEFFLVAGFSAVFFIAHSVMWWKGLFGSFGLERVMACIVPLLALIALRAVNSITEFLSAKTGKTSVIAALVIFVSLPIIILLTRSGFPPKENLSDGEIAIARAAAWIKQENLTNKKIYFSHPYMILQLNLNPKLRRDSDELMYTQQGELIEPGSLIVWDSGYGPAEHHIPLSRLTQDTSLRELKQVRHNNAQVYVFLKK